MSLKLSGERHMAWPFIDMNIKLVGESHMTFSGEGHMAWPFVDMNLKLNGERHKSSHWYKSSTKLWMSHDPSVAHVLNLVVKVKLS